MNKIIHGNCLEVLDALTCEINLVVTSPPYAEQRKNLYESISEKNYPDWTVEWMNKCKRVLVPNGSIAIVIRPHLFQGQISDYILRTRLAVRAAGWYECEELIWIKKTSPPFGSVKRPRRSWESILWFSPTHDPYCNPQANGLPSNRIGAESRKGVGEYKGKPSVTYSGGRGKAKTGISRCKDYVEIGTGEVNRKTADQENPHPAQFPEELAGWMVRLLCPEQGIVLDPFVGSGTTAVACVKNNRNFVGIDISEEYCQYAKKRLENMSPAVDFASPSLDLTSLLPLLPSPLADRLPPPLADPESC